MIGMLPAGRKPLGISEAAIRAPTNQSLQDLDLLRFRVVRST
jgi:hypothetical protein